MEAAAISLRTKQWGLAGPNLTKTFSLLLLVFACAQDTAASEELWARSQLVGRKALANSAATIHKPTPAPPASIPSPPTSSTSPTPSSSPPAPAPSSPASSSPADTPPPPSSFPPDTPPPASGSPPNSPPPASSSPPPSSPSNSTPPASSSPPTAMTAGPPLYEPSSGAYIGLSADPANSLSTTAGNVGVSPGAWNTFVGFPMTAGDASGLSYFLDQVAQVGGIAVITVEPHNGGLAAVTPEACQALADLLKSKEPNVKCLVRFAHEMNGGWYIWGQQPIEYKAAFQLMARTIRYGTCYSGMAWTPNDGEGYPYGGQQYNAQPGTANFDVLDTNHDGVLNMSDDMYMPYYPGDEYVDWVGMSVYFWGPNSCQNGLPYARQFPNKITGAYNSATPNFYDVFCNQHNKPMMVPETSALWNTAQRMPRNGPTEFQAKDAWFDQLFHLSSDSSTALNIATHFPKMKMVVWFEFKKAEGQCTNQVVDWTVENNPQVQQDFVKYVKTNANGYFKFASDFSQLAPSSSCPNKP